MAAPSLQTSPTPSLGTTPDPPGCVASYRLLFDGHDRHPCGDNLDVGPDPAFGTMLLTGHVVHGNVTFGHGTSRLDGQFDDIAIEHNGTVDATGHFGHLFVATAGVMKGHANAYVGRWANLTFVKEAVLSGGQIQVEQTVNQLTATTNVGMRIANASIEVARLHVGEDPSPETVCPFDCPCGDPDPCWTYFHEPCAQLRVMAASVRRMDVTATCDGGRQLVVQDSHVGQLNAQTQNGNLEVLGSHVDDLRVAAGDADVVAHGTFGAFAITVRDTDVDLELNVDHAAFGQVTTRNGTVWLAFAGASHPALDLHTSGTHITASGWYDEVEPGHLRSPDFATNPLKQTVAIACGRCRATVIFPDAPDSA